MKAVMMPHTVPSSPMTGQVEAVVARNLEFGQLDVLLALHRAADILDAAEIGRKAALGADRLPLGARELQ
jgi:hypothetical protein